MQESFDNLLQAIYNSSNDKCIYNVILLRKLLIELMDIDMYKDNIIGSVASLTNAVYSKTISLSKRKYWRPLYY